ncbi:MAG: hypothetical protein LPL00_07565 [Alphaproteobacteria bacterium]|nr:hypothetical protein [Alphaproteobacteria bacterium]MDX5369420.1 hypothetical protein [Alphaproteobacteria bacterium]MDX5464104.1 hypothetical protein [Alphaproteobacteria bacterium]
MAKAQFHKGQRVFVHPVGTWATVEHVLPKWTKGVEEPIRITYDCGLGREFQAEELDGNRDQDAGLDGLDGRTWRVVRARNRWQEQYDVSRHPNPGTYPVIVTGESDWGGWRVPAAEYDLDPHRIEKQAQVMARSAEMLKLLKRLVDAARTAPEDLSDDIHQIARDAVELLRKPRSASSGQG